MESEAKMNKKLSFRTYLISQILILCLGLSFIGGLYYFLEFHSPSGVKPSSYSLDGPVTKEPASLTLDLTSPDDDTLIFQDNIEFSGKTSPNSQILISGADNDMVITSKSDGSFSGDFDLSEGVNEIKVVVFDQNGDQREVVRTVYYSKEKI